MPRPNLPPTPQPSTDITGKNSANAPQLETGFTLPPAALGGRGSVGSSSGRSENASDSSYRPPSPSSPVATSKPGHACKRSSTAVQSIVTKDDYSLPPPPTRSRKIIQMKPKDTQEPPKTAPQTPNGKAIAAATTGTKRKQAANTTAAGRKIARKTAHSLIERRRRSKMNEEFGVLKDMIPACKGQEMHKLAILQASIEYMRYLEQCLSDLKTAHDSRRASPLSATSHLPPPPVRRMRDDDEDDQDQDEDEDMADAVSPTYVEEAAPRSKYHVANASPAIYPSDRSVYTHSTTTSPAIMPHDSHYSADPSPQLHPSDPHHYSLAPSSVRSTMTSPSIHPSPAFSAHTPTAFHFNNPFHAGPPSTGPVPTPGSSHGSASFALTSPALKPQADREDQEATEALMMLNTDRRSWSGARGMSVKDLLSG
ncbi:hypothetical protein BDW02DRAFT_491142 [Decorospora gaudefroyi]|uniref:BHLH domain-containing protein n=1 Tax=Decorospora gaudefroyi TaxID=184978 RepID=A0A6A5KR84_9PLEO|nr:hypothetical protein BDW02DRAFT_491142 [Decorospora gaudefroyi]